MSTGYEDYAFVADLYDHVAIYRDRPDVHFFVDAAVRAGSPVLEIGCGTGRVLIPTARAGVNIVGLDASRRMLAVCRQRLADQPASVRSRVRLVEADMTGFELESRFTMTMIPFRPFQHLLTAEDQLACLSAIRRSLIPGGNLILDIFNPSLDWLVNRPIGAEFSDEPEFVTPDGRRVIRRNRIVAHDRFRQVGDYELIYEIAHPDGRHERLVHAFSLRYMFRYEAEHLLARSGFIVEHVYADYDKTPFGSKYPGELLIVARRAPE